MGKFNNKKNVNDSHALDGDEATSGIDWQKLIATFQTQSVEEAIKNIMEKVAVNKNVEFDQICLILKHYLLLDEDKSYLNHFINHEQNIYLNLLVDRLLNENETRNARWMITELFK